ncbi:lipase secretion chaperone [Pseudomaricurvus sp.]|uniref:lipase secretion chaperone n=1 Tax=Pseudomaricurvus sp. TaxID=2004510 RepID=UPI003F6D22C9
MNNKKIIAIVLASVGVVVAAFAGAILLAEMQPVAVKPTPVLASDREPSEVRYNIYKDDTKNNMSTASQTEVDSGVRSGAQSNDTQDQVTSENPIFDAEGIFEATQKVRVDENGNVILDHDAMLALNEALGQQGLDMDTLSLAQLKDLIQVAMPGKAGSQVALVVGNYYEYLKAKDEYEKLNQDNHLVQDYDARKESIDALRESYLGSDVAEKLFSQSDAESEFMRDNFELASNKDLTSEERQKQKAEIAAKYVNNVVAANGWDGRYKKFVSDKEKLVEGAGEGGLSDVQKEKVMKLWESYFSEEEREKMESLQVPVL